MKVEKIIYKYLEEKGMLEQKEDYASNSIEVLGDDIILSGNKLGLIELADYIINIALSNTKGSHIHLDKYNFFDEGKKQLIIELVD